MQIQKTYKTERYLILFSFFNNIHILYFSCFSIFTFFLFMAINKIIFKEYSHFSIKIFYFFVFYFLFLTPIDFFYELTKKKIKVVLNIHILFLCFINRLFSFFIILNLFVILCFFLYKLIYKLRRNNRNNIQI